MKQVNFGEIPNERKTVGMFNKFRFLYKKNIFRMANVFSRVWRLEWGYVSNFGYMVIIIINMIDGF